MNAAPMRGGETRTLRIEGEMSIYRAAELKGLMLAAFDGAAALAVDLSSVTELDTAGVQLLLAAGKTAQARGVVLRLLAPSEAVCDAVDVLDLGTRLGDAFDKGARP